MDEFQKEAIVTSLRRMFRSPWFSIWTIDMCLRVANMPIPDRKYYDALHAIHNTKWEHMSPQFKNQVIKQSLKIFENEELNLKEFEIYSDKPKNGSLLKISNYKTKE